MKALKKLVVSAALTLGVTTAAPVQANVIEPYSSVQNTYRVDGKEMSVSQAQDAYKAGKTVFQCKSGKASKEFLLNGKVIKGNELSTCKEQILKETKTGTAFKNKPGQ